MNNDYSKNSATAVQIPILNRLIDSGIELLNEEKPNMSRYQQVISIWDGRVNEQINIIFLYNSEAVLAKFPQLPNIDINNTRFPEANQILKTFLKQKIEVLKELSPTHFTV
jgi:hypothetical protein